MGESLEDILPDPENPLRGCCGRGIGFCGGIFLVIGFSSLIWGTGAISPDVEAQYMTQAALTLLIGLILVFVQYRME